jgi:hypothetical protein
MGSSQVKLNRIKYNFKYNVQQQPHTHIEYGSVSPTKIRICINRKAFGFWSEEDKPPKEACSRENNNIMMGKQIKEQEHQS